jgi:hypothetical protein
MFISKITQLNIFFIENNSIKKTCEIKFSDIAVECYEKAKANKKILPLASMKNYMLLFNETPGMKPMFDRSPTSIKRTALNSSPNSIANNNTLTNASLTNTNSSLNNASCNSQTLKNHPVTTTLITATSTNLIRPSALSNNTSNTETIAARTKTDIVIHRGVLSSTTVGGHSKKSIFSEQAKSLNEYSKSTADFATRLRATSNVYGSNAASIAGIPTSNSASVSKQAKTIGLNSLELKPATVEGIHIHSSMYIYYEY